MTKKKAKFVGFKLITRDRDLEVELNGEYLISASYDEHGSAGTSLLEDVVRKLAKHFKLPMVEVEAVGDVGGDD